MERSRLLKRLLWFLCFRQHFFECYLIRFLSRMLVDSIKLIKCSFSSDSSNGSHSLTCFQSKQKHFRVTSKVRSGNEIILNLTVFQLQLWKLLGFFSMLYLKQEVKILKFQVKKNQLESPKFNIADQPQPLNPIMRIWAWKVAIVAEMKLVLAPCSEVSETAQLLFWVNRPTTFSNTS